LDTEPVADYKIFTLSDPVRVVIDVVGQNGTVSVDRQKVFEGGPPSLAQQLGLGIRRIVLDAGHGGRDPGAVGLYGIKEKEVALTVAKAIAGHLQEKGGFETILTRDNDRFLALEERTAIANTRNGDLFVSIHVNASPRPAAQGIETYFLDLAQDEDAMRIAALENATSTRNLSELQDILLDLVQSSKVKESASLAGAIQTSMTRGLGQRYNDVEDLGVKRAPFIVLVGARMPAVLTEIAFLSNHQEARRLQSSEYLDAVAARIAAGIVQYAEDLALAN
jgi:N-acetylmuramoyl-L-alanine amidase